MGSASLMIHLPQWSLQNCGALQMPEPRLNSSKQSSASAGLTHPEGSACELPAICCNSPVFLRTNHQNADPRIRGRDILVKRRPGIPFGVEFEIEELQAAASRGPHFWRVLAYSGGKYQRVNSSQHGSHA